MKNRLRAEVDISQMARTFSDRGIETNMGYNGDGIVEVNLRAIHSWAKLDIDKRALEQLISKIPAGTRVIFNIEAVHRNSSVTIR